MGMFDDLIPKVPEPVAQGQALPPVQPRSAVSFDDLIPKAAGPNDADPGDLAGIGDVVSGMSFPGLLRGLTDIRDTGSQLIGRGLSAISPAGSGLEKWAKDQTGIVERRTAAGQKTYDEGRGPDAGIDVGRIVGNIAGTLPFGGAVPKSLLGKLTANAATGGTAAALSQPAIDMEEGGDGFWSQKAKQTAAGAAGGAAVTPVAALASRLIAPKAMSDPNVQKLLSEDVRLTPGMMAGGALKSAEDKMAGTIPLLGDLIKNRQRAATEDINRAVLNRALSPIGETLPKAVPVGREGVAYVQETLSRKYGEVLGKMPQIRVDAQFNRDMAALDRSAVALPGDLKKALDGYVQNRLVDRLAPTGGAMDGKTMQDIGSELGNLAKSYGSSSDAGQRELAKHFRDLKGFVIDLAERRYPDQAPALKAINKAYGNLTVAENAAGGAGAKEGVFSANQLSSAVKRGDASPRDRQFAAGRARMQDLSDAASAVMPSTVPDSGTAGRSMLGLLGLAGAGYVNPLTAINPYAAPVIGGALGAYTPAGRTALEYLMARGGNWRQPLARGIGVATPAIGAAAGTALAPRMGLFQ